MSLGPPLEHVLRRLAETPEDFLAEPRIGADGALVTAALVADLFHLLGHGPEAGDILPVALRDRNQLQLTAVVVWLLADDWVVAAAPDRPTLTALLGDRVGELAGSGRADQFVADVERREELARTLIAALGLVPAGESAAQAADRLSAVSIVERRRLLRAAQAAEERARAVREALIRKAAEESADKYTRE
nr:hypothetical protein [uncultured Sphingomonas sp.]